MGGNYFSENFVRKYDSIHFVKELFLYQNDALLEKILEKS